MAEAITEMVLPSTYIEVRAEGLIGVSGIVTGNVAVVGTASRGPIDEPVVLSTFTDARQTFGDYDAWVDGASGELTLVRALQQVFGNGGSTRLRRAHRGRRRAASSRALLKGADTVVTLTAVTDGTWGDGIKVQAKAASGNAFVQKNEQTVTATPLKPLHANIAVSPRNVIRVKKAATGQTFRYPLTVGGAAAAGKPTVKANGDLAFVAADTPAAGDVDHRRLRGRAGLLARHRASLRQRQGDLHGRRRDRPRGGHRAELFARVRDDRRRPGRRAARRDDRRRAADRRRERRGREHGATTRRRSPSSTRRRSTSWCSRARGAPRAAATLLAQRRDRREPRPRPDRDRGRRRRRHRRRARQRRHGRRRPPDPRRARHHRRRPRPRTPTPSSRPPTRRRRWPG